MMPAQSPAIRAIVVDDEIWARKRLHVLLEHEADCQIVADCADGESAIRAIRQEAPDLVFLDVQMPDMTGCDVLDAVAPVRTPAIIFVTAHDRYAVEAFDRQAVDYLLKPFDERRFKTAMTRARRDLAARAGESDGGSRPVADHGVHRLFLRRFAVEHRGRLQFVDAADVDCIEAAGNYVCLRVGHDTHLLRISLTALEERLDPDQFARIHRSAIVNLNRIREVRPWSGGEQTLVMMNGRQMTIGRVFRASLAGHAKAGRR
jgi:two-component system LytT family response regulator